MQVSLQVGRIVLVVELSREEYLWYVCWQVQTGFSIEEVDVSASAEPHSQSRPRLQHRPHGDALRQLL